VGRAFGFHQAMENEGDDAGPLIATGLIAMSLSLRQVFWIAVIPGAVATLLVALVKEPRPQQPTATATGASATTAPPARAPLFTRTLVSYLLILGVFSLGNSSDAFLLLRARNLGLPTAQIPVLWSVLNLSKVVWAYLGGDAADRIPRARLVAGGWVVYALVYLGLGQATQPWHVWALFVLYGVFYGLTEPVEKALVRDLAPPDQRGRAYGAYNFVVGVTALPAGLLMGVLWRVWGPAHALEVGAALAAVSGVALLTWDAYRRPR